MVAALIVANWPLAVLLAPPLTVVPSLLAVLLAPPLTVAPSPPAVFS
jgi:hypothetical protein